MIAVALVRFQNGQVVYTCLEQRRQTLVPTNHGTAPKYDMSKINPVSQHFRIPEDKYKDYLKILQSKEGHIIVNILKNQKTNEIINQFLKIKKEEIKLSNEHKKHYNLLSFIEDMMAEGLGEINNMLPKKLICLTKEEIYNEFVKRNLIKA